MRLPLFPVPILLIGFNRPHLLERHLEWMRVIQPDRLYFSVDGARPERTGEEEKVRACRNLAAAFSSFAQ